MLTANFPPGKNISRTATGVCHPLIHLSSQIIWWEGRVRQQIGFCCFKFSAFGKSSLTCVPTRLDLTEVMPGGGSRLACGCRCRRPPVEIGVQQWDLYHDSVFLIFLLFSFIVPSLPWEWSQIVHSAGCGLCLNQVSPVKWTVKKKEPDVLISATVYFFPKFLSSFNTRKLPHLGWNSLRWRYFFFCLFISDFHFLFCHLMLIRGWLHWWGVWQEDQFSTFPPPCRFNMDRPEKIQVWKSD